MITADSYQNATVSTAIYAGAGTPSIAAVVYTALGLASEAGEVAGKVKKALRDEGGTISAARREAILGEVGDVLWYAARLADDLDASLGDVMEANLDKLASRNTRNALMGDGDNR